jgi:hypothetical protein
MNIYVYNDKRYSPTINNQNISPVISFIKINFRYEIYDIISFIYADIYRPYKLHIHVNYCMHIIIYDDNDNVYLTL